MRRTIERIWLMHERAIRDNEPLQEKVLYLNIKYAIRRTKSRSTTELGIDKVPGIDENMVMFKVSCEDKNETNE